MSDNITPEEKLLKLIKGDKKPKAQAAAVYVSLNPEKDKIVRKFVPQKYIHFLNLKKIIAAAFIASCIYLFINLLYPFFGLNKLNIPKIIPERPKESLSVQKDALKPAEYYISAAKSRQLFAAETALPEGKAQVTSVAGPELMKNFGLVGIISGENPQAIIEDKKNLKTYYVSKGQTIDQFKVVDIQEGKIILGYSGQVYELNL